MSTIGHAILAGRNVAWIGAALAAIVTAACLTAAAAQDQPPPGQQAGGEGAAGQDRADDDDHDATIELAEPIRVRFRMIDGVRVTGDATAWSRRWIDGSFGRREWFEIDGRDVWDTYRRLMDIEDARQWVGLGWALLRCALDQEEFAERIGGHAERAFSRALDLDPATTEAIAQARRDIETLRQEREALRKAIEAEKLRTISPEAGEWRPQPWPDLTHEEQNSAVLTMRVEAAKILDKVSLDLVPVETEYFLFYSDMPRTETAQWARELDKMYARLAEIFDLADGRNIFWGKAVIMVFNDQDRFRLVEAQAFNHLASPWAAGFCHQRGPMVFVNFYRQPNDFDFAAVLVHETVHGFMHRYRTPVRLPTWANEGFAEYVASISFRHSPVDRARREQAVGFVRGGGNVGTILAMEYQDNTWPGPESIGYSVSYLLVSLMIQDRPRNFGKWVEAVKQGKDWRQALVEDFGTDIGTLVDRFARYFQVND